LQGSFYRREVFDCGIPVPETVVNREKYSLPEDVLFSETRSYEGWGVLSFRVATYLQDWVMKQALFSFSS